MIKDELLELFSNKTIASDGTAAKTESSSILTVNGNLKMATIFEVKTAGTVSGSGDISIDVLTSDNSDMSSATTVATVKDGLNSVGISIAAIFLNLKKYMRLVVNIPSGRVISGAVVDAYLNIDGLPNNKM